MTEPLPRIASVEAVSDTALRVTWKGGGADVIELAGWIARASPVLAPLRDPALFRAPRLVAHAAAVGWGDEDGDLGIDAYHLSLLAREQRPFGAADLAAWQRETEVSNQEAADLLHASLSQFNAWKAGTVAVPAQVAMLCRAIGRDPILMHAHHRPRKTGRPRKAAVPPPAI